MDGKEPARFYADAKRQVRIWLATLDSPHRDTIRLHAAECGCLLLGNNTLSYQTGSVLEFGRKWKDISSMIEKVVDTFDAAKRIASIFATTLGVSVEIRVSGNRFVVYIPESMRIPDIQHFSSMVHLLRPPDEDRLALLEYVDTSEFSVSSLAWCDPDSSLSWDVSQLMHESWSTEHPCSGSVVMNAVQYAGLTGWRLPTLNELMTLTLQKLDAAGIQYSEHPGSTSFWSSEESFYSGPEKAFFDIATQATGHQRFIEQDKNWSKRGDGYTERARTIFVTAEGRRNSW